VVLDVSSLKVPEPTPSQEPVHLSSPELEQLQGEVHQWRNLYLYSVGLLIFLGAALLFRTRAR
jgi:hypothetical protein